jgi:hypothetical protein
MTAANKLQLHNKRFTRAAAGTTYTHRKNAATTSEEQFHMLEQRL